MEYYEVRRHRVIPFIAASQKKTFVPMLMARTVRMHHVGSNPGSALDGSFSICVL